MLQKMAKNGNNCRLAVLAEEGKMIAAAGGSQFGRAKEWRNG